MHLGYYPPHPPFIAPEPYHAMYDPARMDAPVRAAHLDEAAAQHPLLDYILATKKKLSFYNHGGGLARDIIAEETRQIRATYYGIISEVHEQPGRVIARLEETGEINNTLIVFTSDHGERLGDHYLFGKQGYFDASYHVPLIIVDPRSEADASRGSKISKFTESIDILPSLLEWMARARPRQCDGLSLNPFLHNLTTSHWRTHVHYEYDFREIRSAAAQSYLGLEMDACMLAVIQDEQFKYVHFAGGLPPLLFDLEKDPGQFQNLAGEPHYQAQMLACARAMLDWRLMHSDRTLTAIEAGPGGLFDRHVAAL